MARIPCPTCGQIFGTNFSLNRHIQNLHNNQRRFMCQTCGEGFSQIVQLQRHFRRNHENVIEITSIEIQICVGNHTCQECNRRFTRASNLRSHIQNVHNLMRNFQCEHCEDRFGQLQNMIVHQVNVHQVHFMCSQCHQLYSNTLNADIASFPVKFLHIENCFCQNIT